jgi:hypothetical protein
VIDHNSDGLGPNDSDHKPNDHVGLYYTYYDNGEEYRRIIEANAWVSYNKVVSRDSDPLIDRYWNGRTTVSILRGFRRRSQ